MDIYSVYFALFSLAIKIFTKYCLESKGMKWSLPSWLAFMLRRDGWMVKCTLQMLIITVLVSLFSCLELVDNELSQSLAVKLKNDNIYKSIIFSLFVLTGVQCKTPLLMAPWLNFTLKNMVTLEVASLGKYYLETPNRNVLSFSIFIAMATTIFIMQIQWWLLICNYFGFLWNYTFNELDLNQRHKIDPAKETFDELQPVATVDS